MVLSLRLALAAAAAERTLEPSRGWRARRHSLGDDFGARFGLNSGCRVGHPEIPTTGVTDAFAFLEDLSAERKTRTD